MNMPIVEPDFTQYMPDSVSTYNDMSSYNTGLIPMHQLMYKTLYANKGLIPDEFMEAGALRAMLLLQDSEVILEFKGTLGYVSWKSDSPQHRFVKNLAYGAEYYSADCDAKLKRRKFDFMRMCRWNAAWEKPPQHTLVLIPEEMLTFKSKILIDKYGGMYCIDSNDKVQWFVTVYMSRIVGFYMCKPTILKDRELYKELYEYTNLVNSYTNKLVSQPHPFYVLHNIKEPYRSQLRNDGIKGLNYFTPEEKEVGTKITTFKRFALKPPQ